MKHSPTYIKLVDDAKGRIPEISVEETRARLAREKEIAFVDVREDNEWQAGHAAGAIHIGKGIIERDIEKHVHDKNATLILYCGGGYRSALAADALRLMGYTKVYSMAGGWRSWNDAGGEIES
jgi:rhodanese-related sulfurtransferase